MPHQRSFAVIPAAGRSARMGRPKLLLPWGNATLIEQVLAAWRAGGVERRILVVHHDDTELARLAHDAGAEVVAPAVPPPDMKASVLAALQYLDSTHAPATDDIWLLAPADMPTLSTTVIRALLEAAAWHPKSILVPTCADRRGHPVLFPWSMAADVKALGALEGVNQLLSRHPVVEVPIDDRTILEDVDTPEDYQRLRPNAD